MIIIRNETVSDHYAAELVARRAFGNKNKDSSICSEPYLMHQLRADPAYLPELSRVAESDGRIVGLIMYAKAFLKFRDARVNILTFGPLCVDPDFQGRGIGGLLIHETLALAKSLGHRAVIIFGEPDYYPKHGFSTCDRWGITTNKGDNFPAFMGYELVPDGLNYPGASFHEPSIYTNLPLSEVMEYDKHFSESSQ